MWLIFWFLLVFDSVMFLDNVVWIFVEVLGLVLLCCYYGFEVIWNNGFFYGYISFLLGWYIILYWDVKLGNGEFFWLVFFVFIRV